MDGGGEDVEKQREEARPGEAAGDSDYNFNFPLMRPPAQAALPAKQATSKLPRSPTNHRK